LKPKKNHHQTAGEVFTAFLPVVPQRVCGKPEELCKVQRGGGIFGAQLQHVLVRTCNKTLKGETQKSPKKMEGYINISKLRLIRMEEWSTG